MKCHYSIGPRLLIGTIAFILLANLTSQPGSTSSDAHKNKVNFYGILTLSNTSTTPNAEQQINTQIKVDNISIGRMYDHIPVYAKPKNPDDKPDIVTSYLNLSEIVSVEPVRINDRPVLDKFAGREYIELIVRLAGTATGSNAEQHYVVERNRKVYCDQINDGNPIKNELQFEGILKLEILGYKQRDAEKEIQCVSTTALSGSQEIMKEIEATSADLQKAEAGQLEQLMTKLNNSVKRLKDSLYSIFSMS